MPEEVIEIAAAREVPEIEVIVGHAHLGQYQVGMFDANNQNPVMIRTGDNTVTFDDKFPLTTGAINTLHNKLLVWGVLVTAFSGVSDPYSVTVILTQGTQELARHTRTENLSNGMAPEVGEWRLKVV